MQVVCDGLDLSEAVLKVSRAISYKTTNPILEGIKIVADNDYIIVSATDLDLAIEKKIKAEVKVEGETVVPGKFFSEFVRKLTKEKIELSLNDKNQLKIKYTDSEGVVQCYNSLEYPSFNKIDSNDYFAITENDLKNVINKTIFAVAVDDSWPILKGCLFEINEGELIAVALDGYRLAMVKTPVNSTAKSLSCIIPAKSLSEISKLINTENESIDVLISQNHLLINDGSVKVSTRLLEGEFINYRQVIPSSTTTTIIVSKAQLEDGLDRASLLARMDKNNLVRFDIRDKVLTLTSASNIGNVTENITISLEGKDLSIAFNARYLSDCMHTISDEFIKINFTSQIAPCTICSAEEDKYLYLILPVRIVE